MTCSPRPSRSCCAACPCFPAGPWRWPSRSAPTTRLPVEDVVGLTAGLVDKSLVVVEPEVLGQARYRMLDSIRAYAAQRLAEAGEAAATQLGCATTRWPCASATRRWDWPPSRPAGPRWSPCSAATTRTSPTCARSSAAAWPRATRRPGCASAPPSGRSGSSAAPSTRARAGSPASSASAPRECPRRCWGTALIGRAQLVLPNDPAQAGRWARDGLERARPRAC